MRWPPRSPDLTPCDFFFWVFVKDTVFVPPIPANLKIFATVSPLLWLPLALSEALVSWIEKSGILLKLQQVCEMWGSHDDDY